LLGPILCDLEVQRPAHRRAQALSPYLARQPGLQDRMLATHKCRSLECFPNPPTHGWVRRFQRSCLLSIQSSRKDVLVHVGFLDPKVEMSEDVAIGQRGMSAELTPCPKLSVHRTSRERLNRLKTYLSL